MCMEPVRSSTRVWVFPSRRLAERTAACTRTRWLTLSHKHTCAHTHARARTSSNACIEHAHPHTQAYTLVRKRSHARARAHCACWMLYRVSARRVAAREHSLECSPRSISRVSTPRVRSVYLPARAHSSGDSTARIWTLGNAPDARADSVVLSHIPRWASAMPHSASLVRFGHFREQGGARGL